MQKEKEQTKVVPPTKAHQNTIFAFHFQRFQKWRKDNDNKCKQLQGKS